MTGKKGAMSYRAKELPSGYADVMTRIDQRSTTAKKLKRALVKLHDSLGGEDNLSYVERVLCQRLVFVEALLIGYEAKAIAGAKVEPADAAHAAQLLSQCINVSRLLGVKRRGSKVVSLKAYAQAKRKRINDA